MTTANRDDVFRFGGQPTITYVDRKSTGIEQELDRAIAAPSQIVSLVGPSKSGKTVLCRHLLGSRQFIWVNGGEVKTCEDIWDKIVLSSMSQSKQQALPDLRQKWRVE